MSRIVFCQVLKKDAEGLGQVPHPGELGIRIYENVSAEGWGKWLERLTIIMNEMRISTADPQALDVIEHHMMGFLFGEGEEGKMPEGFQPPGAKK